MVNGLRQYRLWRQVICPYAFPGPSTLQDIADGDIGAPLQPRKRKEPTVHLLSRRAGEWDTFGFLFPTWPLPQNKGFCALYQFVRAEAEHIIGQRTAFTRGGLAEHRDGLPTD